MSSNFVQNAALRSVAMNGYRVWARAQFWRTGSRILVNSIPKAGTHLLTAELARIEGLQNSRLHLQNAEIIKDRRSNTPNPAMNTDRIAQRIATVRGGQYFSAHLPWSSGFEKVLADEDIVTFFVLRDPRDVLASLYHYVLRLKRHPLHAFFADPTKSEFDRYRLLIEGTDTPFMRPMADLLGLFAPWTESERTLTVRFEDLIGERGGGSNAQKYETFQRIATHAGISVDRLPDDIAQAPAKTATLRNGKSGGWRQELPADVQSLVEETCGPTLRRLGYDD